MSFLALVAALLLEQLHPLASRKFIYGRLDAYAHFFEHHFNAGELRHGRVAWLLAVLPPVCGAMLLSWLLYRVHPVFCWAFNVLALYLTMGFRRFSHYFTDIHQALRDGELERARALLAEWRGEPAHELSVEEVARVAIEQALRASHRNVFGVIAWFVIFSLLGLGGAAGALLYRSGLFLGERWGQAEVDELVQFGNFSRRAHYALEWLPVRLTALTFAIVGDFEDTVYCWRTQAATWPDAEEGILLSSGAGALGVRLGMPIPQGGLPLDRPELGIGDDADADFMRSTVGLVWRSVVFWLVLLLLLSLASLLG